MYCKIIRDYFLRIEEAPVFFGNPTKPGETPKNMMQSARFSFLPEEDEEDSPEEEEKEVDEVLDLPKVPSFDYNQEDDQDSNPENQQDLINQI